MPESLSTPDQPQEQVVEQPPQHAERCELCRFWERWTWVAKDEPSSYGYCRRLPPPAVSQIDTGGDPHKTLYFAAWPSTLTNDFCGEFQAKVPAPVSRPASEIGWCEFFAGIKMFPNAKGRMISALRLDGQHKDSVLSVADLISHTAEDLRERREFGAKSLAAIRVRLAEFGLKLKGD